MAKSLLDSVFVSDFEFRISDFIGGRRLVRGAKPSRYF